MKTTLAILPTLYFIAIIFPALSKSNLIVSNNVVKQHNHHNHNHHINNHQAHNLTQVHDEQHIQHQQQQNNPLTNLILQDQITTTTTTKQQQQSTVTENVSKENIECGAHQSCQNGGSCVEGQNNFTCHCPDEFTGPFCDKDVNECAKQPNVCQNGATCLNKIGGYQCICVNGWTGKDCSENVDDCSTAACEAGATCHDRIGRFFCECPPGKTGLLCQNDDGCYQNPCHPNATCDASPVDGHAICTCPIGFSGADCSIDNDECAAGSPCEHGGVCVNTPGSFRCDCPTGFTGSRCEININECDTNPCLNDGTCLDEKGGFKCICTPGYTGQKCQTDIDECAQNPCHNGATCEDSINSFRCRCPHGFWGPRCENQLNNSQPDLEPSLNELSYPLPAGNPWVRCSNSFVCWTLFRDGKCDQQCNTAECLYDGNDCSGSSSVTQTCDEQYCLERYANGVCDQECNSAECGWDGADCETIRTNTMAQGLLVIRVEPAIVLGDGPMGTELAGLLRKVSKMTKTILRILNFRQVDEGRGTEIELIADNSKCYTSCYNSTDLIAKFLSAIKQKTKDILDTGNKTVGQPLEMTDFRSQTQPDSLNTGQKMPATTLFFIVSATLAVVASLLMVISIGNKQRVKEKAVTWFPDGFKPVLSSRNRDPTDRKPGRGVSTLQAMGGHFFRGFKRNERNIATDTTEIDRCNTSTPDGGGIYHEPYDQYTYNGSVVSNVDEPMTPTPMPVNPINMEGPHGLTPLMVASMGPPFSKEPLGLVAYGTTGEINADNKVTDLLQRGAQLSQANKTTGETALHLAARHGRVDAARGLLERCDPQDVNAQDATGRTPLHAAIAADSLGVFELFIRCRGTDLNAHTHDGTTPLILAARTGTYSMLEELILNEAEVTKSDNTGKTALHWAAATNNVDAIRRLLAVRETNKDAQDLAEETPLFLAAREGAKGAVEILLCHNANKDISDQMDRSPIEIARSRQHYDIVRLLEEHEPPTPRSVGSAQHSSRQLSPFSPLADSSSNSSSAQPPPSYHTHSLSQNLNGNGRQGGRQAQKAALARSNSTKPLIAEANIIRNNLQSHCKSVMVIKSEDRDPNEYHGKNTREVKTLGRRATQSTSSSHQAIQPSMQMGQFGAISANNVVMPATPNSYTNSLSPVSSSMMSPPTSSLHHLNSPTKSTPPINVNQNYRQHNSQPNQVPPPAYDDCQTYWTNNNNPNMVSVNNNIIDKTHGLSEYNVPCLKNYMTPSPDSPFSLESNMASPPGVYNEQQYQNPNHPSLTSQKQAGVYI